MGLTTDPNDPCLKNGQKEEGQNTCYLVLSEEERAKGFIRPYRDAYIHKGKKIDAEGTIMSIEEIEAEDGGTPNAHYNRQTGYVAYIKYGEEKSPLVGRYIDQKELDAFKNKKSHVGGCGALTTMGSALSETYARDPKFYGATFCVGCNKHLPVGEFVWDKDGEILGS